MLHQNQVYMLSHAGMVRKQNEDYIDMIKGKNFFVLSDGMGGHNAGEVASKLIVESILQSFKQFEQELTNPDKISSFLKTSIDHASRKVFEKSLNNEEQKGMGGTVVVLFLYDKKYFLSWVGDSRIYLLHKKSLKLLTRDHSYVWQLYNSGNLGYKQMRHHPLRNVITRAVGNSYEVNSDYLSGKYQPGDTFLLCSDGLNNELTDEEINNILLNNDNIENCVKELVTCANSNGGADNVSVILIKTE